MPAQLLSLLMRTLPQIGLALACLGAVWWIDHAGYRRAMADRDARDARLLDAMRTELRASEQRLDAAIDAVAGDYQGQREAIARTGATLQPIILKEAARDPRLSDPALGLAPRMLDAVNRARAAGACAPAAAGRIACAMSAAAAGDEPGHR